MSASVKAAALKACRHFMVPIARFLLNIGVGYTEFAEISKLAFVQVASDEFGIRGRKTNMSRVSVMTGLNRKEIRKLRDRLQGEDWSLNPELSKPVAVLMRWFTDPEYLGPKGAPIWLPFERREEGKSFTDLVRQVGGDVPAGAMLRELQRAECVKEARPGVWKAVKRQYSPGGVDLFQVQRFGECLHDLAETISQNYLDHRDPVGRLFEFRAWSDSIHPSASKELKKLVASGGNAYLESVDDWLAANQQRATSDEHKLMRCGVGVYYFQEISEKK